MIGRNFHLVTLAGFRIAINLSWFFIAILLSWTLASGYFPYLFPKLSQETYWLMGIFGMLGLFISVVLHELGHAIVARHYNLPISQITLFIFGGVAEMKQEPSSPKVEFLVAIAGPIVSVIIAFTMQFLTNFGGQSGWPLPFIGVTGYLAIINTIIVIFNLIPAFPLDGGRIFRAALWWWKNDLKWATTIAAALGSFFGIALIFLGILSFASGNLFMGLWWMVLGFFLQQAAVYSRTQLFVKRELEGEKVEKFMTKDPISVSPTITIKDFIDRYVYQSHHHLYPVTDGGKLIGFISLREVKAIPSKDWETTHVQTAMVPRSEFKTISPQRSAFEALNLIQEDTKTTLLVAEEDRLKGILTAQDLFKIISLKLELEDKR